MFCLDWESGYSAYLFVKTYLLNSILKILSVLLDVHYSSKKFLKIWKEVTCIFPKLIGDEINLVSLNQNFLNEID